MKAGNIVRNSLVILAAASAVGVSQQARSEESAAPKSEVVWKQIGTPPDWQSVAGLAAAGGKLFAVTSEGRLLACDAASTNVVWKTIGDAPGGVQAMGVAEGKLYVSLNARAAGRLLSRDAVTENAAWADIGHAWCLVGIAGVPGKLYALVDTKEVGSEPTIMARATSGTAPENPARGLDGLPWTAGVENERRPPVGALALTVVDGVFYVATKEDALYAGDPTKPDVPWKLIGDAAGVTMLAGGDGKLFAVTKNGKLLKWEPKTSK
jgi:outer membrane protein assembly factor BamB